MRPARPGYRGQPVMLIAGSVKPAKVSVYSKLRTLLVTSGVQFALGQVKVARNSAVLVPVVVWAGTTSLPFLVEVSSLEVEVVTASEKGSTTLLFTPGLWHTPLIVEVTASSTVAFVLPTPSIAVPVQVTVVPLTVQIGSAEPLAKCAPEGALSKLTTACAADAKPSIATLSTAIKKTRLMM
jgi:hypothetical protein